MTFDSRSRTARRFRKSLLLGTLVVALPCCALECTGVESTAYFGGEGLASSYERLEAMERDRGVEVIAIGPSHVENGFDAELFTERTSTPAFNLGISGTDLHFQALFARHVLIPLFRPRTIFWGVLEQLNTTNPINAQYLESAAVARFEGGLGARVIELEHALPQWKKRRLADWYERVTAARETADPFGQARVSGVWDQVQGAALRDGVVPPWMQRRLAAARHARRTDESTESAENDGTPEDGDATAATENLPRSDPEATERAFDEALGYARAQGVQVYVFMAPYDPGNFERGSGYAKRRAAGTFREYEEWLTRTLAKHGVPLVNLRHCAGITDVEGCFYQPRHLNVHGARAMTEILARIFSGEAIRAEWRDAPSQAELEALGSM